MESYAKAAGKIKGRIDNSLKDRSTYYITQLKL